MNYRYLKSAILFIFLACSLSFGAEPNETSPEARTVKAAVIVCKDMIDDGLYKSILRRSQEALDAGAEYLIYEISTYGGLVKSADDISKYFMLDVGKKVKTVAFITTEAISAGAMISVACQDIIMVKNTKIGDCAPITMGGKLEGVEREKAESFIRATFSAAAKANNYPEALLLAMVSIQIEVYKIKNLESGEYEFFEGEHLPKDDYDYDIDNKELVVSKDKLYTPIASEAVEYGIARAEVNDLDEALDFLAKRDGVVFEKPAMVLKTIWSEEMVRWLNSPAVMGVLVMIAMLGVYIELNTPGLGLPGLVAVICFVIIISSKHLVGLANWVEVAIFLTGLSLLVIEVFVLPGFGIAGILGIICIFAGLFGMLIKNPPDELPWPKDIFAWDVFTDGVLGMSAGLLGFFVFAWIFTKYLPKWRFLSGLTLVPAVPKEKGAALSMTSPPRDIPAGVSVGDIGEVTFTLRPTGKARFGETVVDVVAEAEFLDNGTKVEIIEIHGNRAVVKAAEN